MTDGAVVEKEVEPVEAVVESPKVEVVAPLTEREIAIIDGVEPKEIKPESDGGEVKEDVGQAASTPVASGKEAAPSDDSEAEKPWADATAVELARSYGLTEDDLKQFSGPEEFNRAALLFDRTLLSKGQAANAVPAKEDNSPAEAAPPPKSDSASPDGLVDPQKFIDAGYDETTVEMAKALRAQQEQTRKLQQYVEQSQAEQQAYSTQRVMETFHDYVDALDDPLFGKSLDEQNKPVAMQGKSEGANREKLYQTAYAIQDQLVRDAQLRGAAPEIPPLPVLLRRARLVAFSDEIMKREKREYQERVAAQSKRRRPSAGRPKELSPAEKETDPAKALANDPAIVKLWNHLQEESGAA